MVIRDFCKECKGKDCCDRILKVQCLNDEYKDITNIILDIYCDLYRFGAINCTAYGSLRSEIIFEKEEFTQCQFCLYRPVCKYDPEVIMKEANNIINKMKDIVDCKIACASFHPNQQSTEKAESYNTDDIVNTFCELLDLKKISIPISTGNNIGIFIHKDAPVDILNIKNKHNKTRDLVVIDGGVCKNKDKKGFFKGRKRNYNYSHIKYNN